VRLQRRAGPATVNNFNSGARNRKAGDKKGVAKNGNVKNQSCWITVSGGEKTVKRRTIKFFLSKKLPKIVRI
jgi:hypothetical protein